MNLRVELRLGRDGAIVLPRLCTHEGGCTTTANGVSMYCEVHQEGKNQVADVCIDQAPSMQGDNPDIIGARGKRVSNKRPKSNSSNELNSPRGSSYKCSIDGCSKFSRGGMRLCISHGGGKRCSVEGCSKSALGNSGMCIAHGGGKRCRVSDCEKSAIGRSGVCIAHGGGTRCSRDGCNKVEQGGTGLCVAHGGGRRCKHSSNCNKLTQSKSMFCRAHSASDKFERKSCSEQESSTSYLASQSQQHLGQAQLQPEYRCSLEGGAENMPSIHNVDTIHGNAHFPFLLLPEATNGVDAMLKMPTEPLDVLHGTKLATQPIPLGFFSSASLDLMLGMIGTLGSPGTSMNLNM